MNNNARNLIYMGRIVPMEEILAELNKVTGKQIMEYMNTYCLPEYKSVTMVGNIEEYPELSEVFELF